MSVALYLDQHVPKAIRSGLRARQVDVVSAFEDGTSEWDDDSLLDRVLQVGRVLFTQDEDFLVIANQRQTAGIPFAGILFARQRDISIQQAIRDLELIAKVCEPSDFSNRVEFLPYQ